jgi:hypothetical protein
MGLQIQASLEAGIDVRQESKKYERLEFENDHGIRARVTAVQGEFIYELRVPLGSASGSPYHVAAAPGDQVSLRIRNGGAPASGGGPAGGSVGGSSGGMPSSGGLTGMSGGGGGELSGGGSGYRPPDSLKIDAKVTLATGPGN